MNHGRIKIDTDELQISTVGSDYRKYEGGLLKNNGGLPSVEQVREYRPWNKQSLPVDRNRHALNDRHFVGMVRFYWEPRIGVLYLNCSKRDL